MLLIFLHCQFGVTALLYYVQNCVDIQDELLVAFLRCGADMCLKNQVSFHWCTLNDSPVY